MGPWLGYGRRNRQEAATATATATATAGGCQLAITVRCETPMMGKWAAAGYPNQSAFVEWAEITNYMG